MRTRLSVLGCFLLVVVTGLQAQTPSPAPIIVEAPSISPAHGAVQGSRLP
jgi:hypothetical protein